MTGFGEAYQRFDAELDAAVSRARRVAADARAESGRFRAQTARLTESVRDRTVAASAGELTSEQLQEQAKKFRTEQGLPVEQLPSAAELAASGLVEQQRPPAALVHDEDEDFSQERILSASVSREPEAEQAPAPQPEPQPQPRPRRARPVPRSGDDDEDFSQERILFEG